jgi:hypothetical protein
MVSMSTRTPTELAETVLLDLGVTDPYETPETEDTDNVIAAYENKYAELRAPAGDRELIYWARDEIPIEVFAIMCDLMENECASGYGEPMDVPTKEQNEIIILKRLRRHVSKAQSGVRTPAEYF